MEETLPEYGAWIEDSAGTRIPIRGTCDLGRAAGNCVTIDDCLVSRRHAQIQARDQHEYWLVDFGSRNGTYRNSQRVAWPARLQDGDLLLLGGTQYRFRQVAASPAGASHWGGADQTVLHVRRKDAWLLVADIVDSTRLVKELPPDELPLVTGNWLLGCRDTIEGCGGRINQFLGDGFFAFWLDEQGREADLLRAMESLRRHQRSRRPPFRFAVHLAKVVLGGLPLGEAERISGEAVHFVFRMEKLAAQLGADCLLSATAQARLAELEAVEGAGRHALPGFPGEVDFYAWRDLG
jgi:adenylate cyclase